mgnify:FL=1
MATAFRCASKASRLSQRNRPPRERPPEGEARRVISAMLVLTLIVTVVVASIDALDVSVKSMILIFWIAVMLAVLRRYRL